MNTLMFNNKVLQVVEKNNQIWISASDLANALNYKRSDYVTRIYNRNSDEFTCNMTETVKLTLSGNLSKTVRFFSLRGAHLIAMFASTDVAKMFRKWVLDILDKESGIAVIDQTITHSQEQALIRAINCCVERTKQHCDDISACLCKAFNINKRSELPASKLDDAYAFLNLLTKKEIVGRRYLVEVKITDFMFNGEKTIKAKCDDFNVLLTNLALNLGYKIDRLSSSPKTLSF